MKYLLCFSLLLLITQMQPAHAADKPKRIAAIVTTYFHNSHADVIVSRLLQTATLDGKGKHYKMKLVSLYTDQVPKHDISRQLSREYGFPIYTNVRDALTLGTSKLAVDGVLLVAEHGDYPVSATGNTQYPKRRLFSEIAAVFEQTGQSVPVFVDKHLADNWTDAKWLYDTAQRLHVPIMAGSSLPVTWRYPPADVKRGAKLKQILALSYHTLDHYGFHAVELSQTLAEQRHGGETGIKAVQCLTDEAVWKAGEQGIYDQQLFDQAFARLQHPTYGKDAAWRQKVEHPVLFVIDYNDGLRTCIFTLNFAVGEWSAAWRYEDGGTASSLFWTQEARPLMHFSLLDDGIEKMMLTGKPAWPAERTLLTSGALDALLISKSKGGERVETPYLDIHYKPHWRWRQPPPPPPGRPLDQQ